MSETTLPRLTFDAIRNYGDAQHGRVEIDHVLHRGVVTLLDGTVGITDFQLDGQSDRRLVVEWHEEPIARATVSG